MEDALKIIASDSLKENVPQFSVGDTVRVDVKIREGERERIQSFEGTVVARKGSGISETFTVRRVSYGVGVERVFPLHSPNVADVKVIRRARFAAASCTTFASASANLPVLKSRLPANKPVCKSKLSEVKGHHVPFSLFC